MLQGGVIILVGDLTGRCLHLLRRIEGQGEIVSPLFGIEGAKVEGLWVEMVDQRAESHAIVPAA